jgi:hypothetical protein
MSGPRNKVAFALGQKKRAAIRELMASRSPLLPSWTLPELQAALARRGVYLALSSIAHHRSRIWLEEAQKDGCSSSLSINPGAA